MSCFKILLAGMLMHSGEAFMKAGGQVLGPEVGAPAEPETGFDLPSRFQNRRDLIRFNTESLQNFLVDPQNHDLSEDNVLTEILLIVRAIEFLFQNSPETLIGREEDLAEYERNTAKLVDRLIHPLREGKDTWRDILARARQAEGPDDRLACLARKVLAELAKLFIKLANLERHVYDEHRADPEQVRKAQLWRDEAPEVLGFFADLFEGL